MKNMILPKLRLLRVNKIITFAAFFIITPLIIVASLITLFMLDYSSQDNIKNKVSPQVLSANTNGVQIFASLPSSYPTISQEILAADARGEIIKNYLTNYNSPLVPYAYLIVNTADKYDIDFRLITAIAQQESNLCKIYPEGTYNCWGWGIHSQGTLGFSSFEQGIEEVTKGLKENYIDKGYKTPETIMTKYTPLSNGSWAKGVDTFLGDME